MAELHKIALFGAGGTNIGYHLIRAFLADGSYNVTVLARASSKSTYPSAVNVIKINDFNSHSELVSALKGQDVLISGIGPEGFGIQHHLAGVCVEVGVKRFIPTEWGFDNQDLNARELCPPIFGAKGKFVDEVLKKTEDKMTWTAVASSIWLDWALSMKFLGIDPEHHTVKYWRDGASKWTATTLPYTAAAVIQILKNPEATANKRVFVEPFTTTQREIVAELEGIQGVKYEELPFDADAEVQKAKEMWLRDHDITSIYITIPAVVLLSEYEPAFGIAGKKPILEHMENVTLPKLSAKQVVDEWVNAQFSTKA